jgi:hypothetical protein
MQAVRGGAHDQLSHSTKSEAAPLEVFWGKGDAAKALHRECLETIARKYGSVAIAGPAQPARKPRKPSIRKLVEQAEKATGKTVWAITMPDGTRLDFGAPELVATQAPWSPDEFRTKETKQ